ncbi:MAG: penicillin acylase family protein [Nocardioides sp.]|nr:penicillin acylase family protein [Nocardioides sp.]
MSDSPEATTPAPSAPRGFRAWPRTARWATGVAVVVVLALVAALVTAVVLVRRPFPQTSGEIDVPGLSADVEVLRDEHGIPQVYADTAEDLFLAQGFVHAQDRFFEMDFRRHVTAGRVSELVGEGGLETDRYIRTMGWRRVAEQELSLLSAETRTYLDAYAAGVNAYTQDRGAGALGLEYTVLSLDGLDYTPEPWTAVDSVAWLKAMAWDLRGNMTDEIGRALATVDVGADRAAELYPDYPFDRHRPIVEGGGVVDGVFEPDATGSGTRKPARAPLSAQVDRLLEDVRAGVEAMPAMVGKGRGVGSNSWVVAGDRTTTGSPLLANDPHLGISVPGIWHQMGLHCRTVTADCPFDVSGFTFSGVPGVVIGHNAEVAWGFTNLGPDVVDLVLERVQGDTFLREGSYREMQVRTEQIEVLGRDEPVPMRVRETRNGPLLSDVSNELATVGANAEPEDVDGAGGAPYAVALRWTALTPGRTADAIFAFGRATTWEEFRAAAELFEAPSQNLVYADKQGRIGYQAPGRIPVRRAGNDGTVPVAGWSPAGDWLPDPIPFDALPSVVDPDEGFIATANQAAVGEDYPFFLTGDWGYGYRSQRIIDVLETELADGGTVSPDDMARLQLDARNGFAPTFVPYLLEILQPSGYYASAQELLRDWDFDQQADSPAAAYYNAVWAHTLRLTFHDELRESLHPDGGDRWFEVMRRLLEEPESPWWDDVETDTVVETRDDILMRAMQDARDDLVRRQARDPQEWTWGHHHRMDLAHQPLGESGIGVVEWLFNRGGYEVDGGDSIVNATGWTASEGYEVDWAPSMRMVVDLADLDASRWINLTGVSGHPFHRHHVDQTDLWVDGETLPWPFSPEAVQEAAEDTLVLRAE